MSTRQEMKKHHVIESNDLLLYPEDGLLIGNGDFSVSIYQTRDRIVWRFGKGDVWDRRVDYSVNPKPIDIEELRHGIEVERWKSPPYGDSADGIVALNGTKDPKRMREMLMSPPAQILPYPMAKPAGELVMQLPPDLCGRMKISQRVVIEESTVFIRCEFADGPVLDVECFIPPSPDVLVVKWKMTNWDVMFHHPQKTQCIWFSLYRWADTPIRVFLDKFWAEYREMHDYKNKGYLDRATPLPPPKAIVKDGVNMIEQCFPAEATFPDGFRYRLVPFVSSGSIQSAEAACVLAGSTPALPDSQAHEARLHIRPDGEALEGYMVVGIATSLSEGGVEGACDQLKQAMGENAAKSITSWKKATLKKAAEFWSKSSVQIAEPLLEGLWYETLHAQRSVFRGGTVPPGQVLPSTLNDYSRWHGDYHTNYNIEQPFLGTLATNHPEIMEAYFDACDYLIQMGRKIAHDYYHCRGTFIQISGFPIKALDDIYGTSPDGRMVYMTGMLTHHYWRYFLCTQDKTFLKARGYPFLRDAALFYTDFLKKGADGLYHAFPSVAGEDPMTGDPEDARDLGENMVHIRWCLRSAIEASEVLCVDEKFRAEWRERLDHLAPSRKYTVIMRNELTVAKDEVPAGNLSPLQKWNAQCSEPEFGTFLQNYPSLEAWRETSARWYLGHQPYNLVEKLRSGMFKADRDFEEYRTLMRHWRHPNGLYPAMCIEIYGHCGAWAESLGVIAPLNEMMLQGYNHIMNVFPNWPRNVNASFRDFRMEGAFLVSAAWENGKVIDVEIVSERGLTCRLFSPWKSGFQVKDGTGKAVTVTAEPEGVFRFETTSGGKYRLHPV